MAAPTDPGVSVADHETESADAETVIGPEALRGLAHPLRLRLLAELGTRGRATATQLAGALGESSGATSYHLRQLFRHGLIEEDDAPARGKERYWRPLRGGWTLPAFELAQHSGARSTVETALQQMITDDQRALERIWALAPAWPARWRDRIRRRQSHLTLSPGQTLALQDELDEVLDRYRQLAPGDDPRRVVVNVDILPTEFGPDGSPVPLDDSGPAADRRPDVDAAAPVARS